MDKRPQMCMLCNKTALDGLSQSPVITIRLAMYPQNQAKF